MRRCPTLGHIPIKGVLFSLRVRFPARATQEIATARFDLTDFEWSVIEPLLPSRPRGVPRADDRRVLSGIFWRLQTVARWLSCTLHRQFRGPRSTGQGI
ncbi:hypothetical protein B7H23_04450 [Notoacmeibacter marinus]|uniref:Insertion element IS402-like domain-containing protein n=1 Tax=Notoacmeibacter marinus TaxID=1876515 RepID=A0A231V242_9HYPH|nr:hypothetical protein B7H23_04450 [Notoacmeibacter marinus]